MAPELKPETPDEEDELFIHLDLDGLAALLRAVEAALATGRGHVTTEAAGGKGVSASSGASREFERVTVTFARPRAASLQ